MTHSVDYKGMTIVCENGIYHIALVPEKKFLTFPEAKKEVDSIVGVEQENFINIKTIKSGK